MGEMFDRIGKYVVTRSDAPLEWQNSHRVASMEALADLKRQDGPDLVIQGSSTLYPQLLEAGLLDELTLMISPVVLGQGKRLFGRHPPRTMTLASKGHEERHITRTYEPGGEADRNLRSRPVAAEPRRERMRGRVVSPPLELLLTLSS